jgi:Flp pilus assembly protein TadG
MRFHFIKNQRGAVVLGYAAMALGILIASLAGIDIIRWTAAQNRLQYAVDTAALAAGRNLGMQSTNNCQWLADTADYFNLNMPAGYVGSTINPLIAPAIPAQNTAAAESACTVNGITLGSDTTTGGETITLKVSGSVPLLVAGLIHSSFTSLPVFATATALRVNNAPVWLTLVLDNSGSMNDSIPVGDGSGNTTTKIAALQAEADSLIDTLISKSNQGNVYIGLVPFTTTVNVRDANENLPTGSVNGAASWLSTLADASGNTFLTTNSLANVTAPFDNGSNGTWKGCIAEPQPMPSSYLSSDTTQQAILQDPTTKPFRAFFDGWTTSSMGNNQYYYSNFTQTYCVAAHTEYLTNNTSTLKNTINSMKNPQGSTFIATGVLWGWRMLNRSIWWKNSAWGSSPPSTSPPVWTANQTGVTAPVRAMILITDGNNEWQLGVNSLDVPDITKTTLKNGSYLGGTVAKPSAIFGTQSNTDASYLPSPVPPTLSPFPATANVYGDTGSVNVEGSIYQQVCQQAEADGISVYAIVYGQTNAELKASQKELEQCQGATVYTATTASALSAKLSAIAGNLNTLRLVQ